MKENRFTQIIEWWRQNLTQTAQELRSFTMQTALTWPTGSVLPRYDRYPMNCPQTQIWEMLSQTYLIFFI